jgi:predicted transposase YbfD/YdcC
MNSVSKLVSIFGSVEDPRSDINKLHNLVDILLIGIVSVICGAETWKQMIEFANSKVKFLSTFLESPNGIPSEDTINRVFSSIDSSKFETCFIDWVNSISELSKGQVRVNEKSNEITAIPILLETLFIEGNIITIDAMGTQTDIADKIIENKADYILAVKGNQKQLSEEIKDEFKFSKNIETNIDIDYGHGRIETRKCSLVSDFQFIDNSDNKWNNLNQIIKIESQREFKNSNKLTEKSTRYYISSLKNTAVQYQKNIRSHWGWKINYIGHWMLLFLKMPLEKERIMQLKIILSF